MATQLLSAALTFHPLCNDGCIVKSSSFEQTMVERFPEISWLASQDVKRTHEGKSVEDNSFSVKLFGQKFDELDRTLMTLKCMELLLSGDRSDYDEFTRDQKGDKLSFKSFLELHTNMKKLSLGMKGLGEESVRNAMRAALVLGDMGKSQTARVIFGDYGVIDADHDDFYTSAMRVLKDFSGVSKTFDALGSVERDLLVEGSHLAHYGHITHLEGGYKMFSRLRESGICITNPKAFEFDFLVHVCDVAGALGHVNNTSSLVMTENVYLALKMAFDSCMVLSNPDKTETDAYNYYLSKRAEILNFIIHDRVERVLTRIACQMRLFSIEDGRVLHKSFIKLPEEIQERILTFFDERFLDDKRTPTYIPAVLINLMNNSCLGESREKRLEQAMLLGLPFITKVFERYTDMLARGDVSADIPICFNPIAKIAKDDPRLLSDSEFVILENGDVVLK